MFADRLHAGEDFKPLAGCILNLGNSSMWRVQVFSVLFWECVFPGPVCVCVCVPNYLVYIDAFKCLNFPGVSLHLFLGPKLFCCIPPRVISCPRHLVVCGVLVVFHKPCPLLPRDSPHLRSKVHHLCSSELEGPSGSPRQVRVL